MRSSRLSCVVELDNAQHGGLIRKPRQAAGLRACLRRSVLSFIVVMALSALRDRIEIKLANFIIKCY